MIAALSLKAELRRAALDRRARVPEAERTRFSASLAREGVALALRLGAGAASAYHPVRGEPDTLPLLDALATAGVMTALPVTPRDGETLAFRRWRTGEPTVAGPMRIPEPPPDAPALQPDLLFVPLAAFDRRGHRIGYGAGHYDRALRHLRALRPTTAVGVAFDVSEIEAIPEEPHDEPLDYVLTNHELIQVKR